MYRPIHGMYTTRVYYRPLDSTDSVGGATVVLVPEPTNAVDPHAVALREISSGTHCGYLGSGMAQRIRPHLDEAARQGVSLTGILADDENSLVSGLPEYLDMSPRSWGSGWHQISRLRLRRGKDPVPLYDGQAVIVRTLDDGNFAAFIGAQQIASIRMTSRVDRGAPELLRDLLRRQGQGKIEAAARFIRSTEGYVMWVAVVNYDEDGYSWI